MQVDSLVDYIVDEHHVDFNRALQNYSQVIRLMSESQVFVHQLRKQLVNAEENLSVDTEMLLQKYHRHAMLTEIVNLIDDIDDIVRAESDIDGYAHKKDWKSAVSVLMMAGNKLAREEICHIPAMKSLLPGLRKKSKELLAGILKDVEEEAFQGFSLKGLDSRGTRKSKGRRNFSWGSDWVSSNRNLSRTLKFQSMMLEDFSPSKAQEPSAGHRRTETLGVSGKHDGHVMSSEAKSLLIPCVAQLGGVADCLESIENRATQKVSFIFNTLCWRLVIVYAMLKCSFENPLLKSYTGMHFFKLVKRTINRRRKALRLFTRIAILITRDIS